MAKYRVPDPVEDYTHTFRNHFNTSRSAVSTLSARDLLAIVAVTRSSEIKTRLLANNECTLKRQ